MREYVWDSSFVTASKVNQPVNHSISKCSAGRLTLLGLNIISFSLDGEANDILISSQTGKIEESIDHSRDFCNTCELRLTAGHNCTVFMSDGRC